MRMAYCTAVPVSKGSFALAQTKNHQRLSLRFEKLMLKNTGKHSIKLKKQLKKADFDPVCVEPLYSNAPVNIIRNHFAINDGDGRKRKHSRLRLRKH